MMSQEYFSFQNPEAAEALRQWWAGLENDRGGRAHLRRASSPTEIVFEPAFHRLLRALEELDGVGKPYGPAVAAVAGLAARVKEPEASQSPPAQMASSKPGSQRPRVSKIRFRRLLEADDLEDRFTQLGRALRLLDGRVNLSALAEAAYRWNEPLRRRWAYDYYRALPND